MIPYHTLPKDTREHYNFCQSIALVEAIPVNHCTLVIKENLHDRRDSIYYLGSWNSHYKDQALQKNIETLIEIFGNIDIGCSQKLLERKITNLKNLNYTPNNPVKNVNPYDSLLSLSARKIECF